MLKKTLIAMMVAGAVGGSPGVLAESSSGHTAYNSDAVSTSAHPMTPSLQMDTSIDPVGAHVSAPIEIGDGILASIVDDEFDGLASLEDGTAVGATSSAGGTGAVGFSSDGRLPSSSTAHASSASAIARDEIYLVPAPLAHYDGARHWKVEVGPSEVGELDRLATENVYVMTPIEDAIVDPQIALTGTPDALVDALGTS
jgi:hypothetical protein